MTDSNWSARDQATGSGNAYLAVDGAPVGNGNPVPVGSALLPPVTGQKAVTATATALGTGAAKNGFVVTSLPTNTATVFVGGATVNTTVGAGGTGYPLAPGQSIALASALSDIYVIGTVGNAVAYAGN